MGYAIPVQSELSKLSLEEMNAMMQMAAIIIKGRYHREYIKYYRSVIDELRKELDVRIQNKIFDCVC